MIVFLVVMASLVATGRPALIVPETNVPQQIAVRPWTERLNISQAFSRIGVLQRMTLKAPDAVSAEHVTERETVIARAPVDPRHCALPPPVVG